MMRSVSLLVGCLVVALTANAAAQNASVALPPRLGADAKTAIERIIDSTRVAGLPVGPLADKAAEGVLKGADDQRIVIAIRVLARELGEARAVIGSSKDAALLTATASALHAGAAAEDLRRLVHPPGNDPFDPHSVATAFVTLVDLVAKHISPPAATTAVGELLKRRAPDDQFIILRSEVEQDIRAGVSPEAALTHRIRSHVQLLDDVPLSSRPIRRPPTSPVM